MGGVGVGGGQTRGGKRADGSRCEQNGSAEAVAVSFDTSRHAQQYPARARAARHGAQRSRSTSQPRPSATQSSSPRPTRSDRACAASAPSRVAACVG